MNQETIYDTLRIMRRIIEHPYVKVLGGFALSVLSFLFDPATKVALFALLALIAFDFITSLYAIHVTGVSKRGKKFTSHSALGSAIKTIVYFIMISAGFIAESAVPIGLIDNTIIGFLVVTELVSILENIGRVGYGIPLGLLNKLIEYRDGK